MFKRSSLSKDVRLIHCYWHLLKNNLLRKSENTEKLFTIEVDLRYFQDEIRFVRI